MITLYCSNKLQTYLGFKKSEIESDKNSELQSWNAHIFRVDRKNCLYFMNQETYFSFIVFNIKKADMKNLVQLFKIGFIQELKKCGLINDSDAVKLQSEISELFLHTSINNRKIIGNMNNLIMIVKDMKYFIEDNATTEEYYNTNTINEIPLVQLDFHNPKEAMREKVKLLFK